MQICFLLIRSIDLDGISTAISTYWFLSIINQRFAFSPG